MDESRSIENSKEIAAIWESVKSAHKRIDENDRTTEGIHKLAANMEALTLQVKMLIESLDNSVSRLEGSQKAQGERIGNLEKRPELESEINEINTRLSALEGKSGKRWESLVAQVISLVIAAVVGAIIAKIM